MENLAVSIAIVLCSAFFSFLLNKILLRHSIKLGTGDNPEDVRWRSSKPTIGGISFYITFILAALVFFIIQGSKVGFPSEFLALLTITTIGFFLGLSDDAYNTRPRLKLMMQIACAVVLIYFGVFIRLFGTPFLDYPITVFWVVGIMNSVNLLDNMDGVTGTVSMVILAVAVGLMTQVNYLSQSHPVFYTLLASIGALAGFLILNWNPSKIFMGDTGSQFLGALLAFVGIKFFWNFGTGPNQNGDLTNILVPIMVFIVPIMDTTFVTINRIRQGRSPFQGGRDHLTHHITYSGLASEKWVAAVLGCVTLIFGATAVFAVKYSFLENSGFASLFDFALVGSIMICVGTFYWVFQRGERYRDKGYRFLKTMKSNYQRRKKKKVNGSKVASVKSNEKQYT